MEILALIHLAHPFTSLVMLLRFELPVIFRLSFDICVYMYDVFFF